MNLLEGKICIITGGGRGIGRATALKFSDEGAKVVIAEFDEKSGQATADEVIGLFVQANVGDKKSVDELFKAVMDTYGRVDVLINNAGILKDRISPIKTAHDGLVQQNDVFTDSLRSTPGGRGRERGVSRDVF